ncbi:unnamed protein product [Danaus chrysippus]|uniref:(African queen) hypothetical protein n=1 Tax=Danaus chrysippus TaxID=151541 RepID=A0A8J2QH11_9NEOP|nr:unnamed protein product [Danaus chrysippus]
MDNLTIDVRSCSALIPTDAVSTVHDEGSRVCPLCSSEIRLFYINFNEKLLMCENTECDFPFGYEEIKLVRVENYEDISDTRSGRTKPSMMSPSRSSIASTAAWSEIEKLNKVTDDLDDTQIEIPQYEKFSQTKKTTKLSRDSKMKIQKHAEELKDLDKDLMKIKTDPKIINNEKWIKNLMSLQGISGKSLLQPQELIKLKKRTERKKSELKIDIEKGETGMSSITIHLGNKETTTT